MTIRIEHLTIAPDAGSWLSTPEDGVSIMHDETRRLDLLSMVRHIMRDERCDMVPVVVGAVVHPTNTYGHNMQVEVQYAKRGWRAIFAAHAGGEGLTNVQCYMD